MERLTQTAQYRFSTFNRCQICGHTSDDICEFRLWRECNDTDTPELYNILVTCAHRPECLAIIEEHPRLYIQLSWGTGLPGHLSLLCNDCSYRNGTRCTHPDLKANGGTGLTLHIGNNVITSAIYCVYDESKPDGGLSCRRHEPPYISCAGLPPTHPRSVKNLVSAEEEGEE